MRNYREYGEPVYHGGTTEATGIGVKAAVKDRILSRELMKTWVAGTEVHERKQKFLLSPASVVDLGKENFHRAHNNRQKGVEGIERWSTLREDRLVRANPDFPRFLSFKKSRLKDLRATVSPFPAIVDELLFKGASRRQSQK